MQYKILPKLLAKEGVDFQNVNFRWRPTTLLYLPQARFLLNDIQTRFAHLSDGEDELRTLPDSDRYPHLLIRMRFAVRQAGYVWKMDQLSFIKAVSVFYGDYGTIMRLLRIEREKGRFDQEPKK